MLDGNVGKTALNFVDLVTFFNTAGFALAFVHVAPGDKISKSFHSTSFVSVLSEMFSAENIHN